MTEEFKELNIAGIFTLRYSRTKEGNYQQTYTPAEFEQMQGWLGRALDECIQSKIKEALAQPEQEPVAWEQFYPDIGKPQIEQPKVRTGDCLLVGVCASESHKIQKAQSEQEEYLSKAYRMANELRCHLAIAPAPQRTWVGLTRDEQSFVYSSLHESTLRKDSFWVDFANAIEAKLKEKNT